jgi:hypothetical protein
MTASIQQVDNACRFASELGVSISSDLDSSWSLQPIVSRIDLKHGLMKHITDSYGMDYYMACINYMQDEYVNASRLINVVMPGYRSKLAYTLNGSSTQKVIVHKGYGYLIVGSPDNTEDDDETISTINSFRLDPEVSQQVTIPAGKFYTIESAYGSDCPLVVSSLYREMDMNEIEFIPGTEELSIDGHSVIVPDEFYTANFN